MPLIWSSTAWDRNQHKTCESALQIGRTICFGLNCSAANSGGSGVLPDNNLFTCIQTTLFPGLQLSPTLPITGRSASSPVVQLAGTETPAALQHRRTARDRATGAYTYPSIRYLPTNSVQRTAE